MFHTMMLPPEQRRPDDAAAGKQRAQQLIRLPQEPELPGAYRLKDKLHRRRHHRGLGR